jgi:hypothetical protein
MMRRPFDQRRFSPKPTRRSELKRNSMSRQNLDRILFDRIWHLGAQAVKDDRLSTLAYATVTKPTLEEYRDSRGSLQADLIKVIQLGILKLRERGELQEP